MLLSNRLRFFDKKGNGLNPDYSRAVIVKLLNAGQGYGAVINAYTNDDGVIIHVEILSGGYNYDFGTYIEFEDANTGQIWTTTTNDISVNAEGIITSFTLPASIDNTNFSYPVTSLFVNQFLDPVSTGLISSDHIFIVENVFDKDGKSDFTYPRVEEYGPFEISHYGGNGTAGYVRLKTIALDGNILPTAKNVVYGVSSEIIAQLGANMLVEGRGIPLSTRILEIDSTYNTVTLSNYATVSGAVSLDSYYPHNLREGNTIRVFSTEGSNLFAGTHILTATTNTVLYFDSPIILTSETAVENLYFGVRPVYRAYITAESDQEFFLFDVSYDVDYPVINKRKEVYFEFANASDAAEPDTLPGGNLLYQRTVYERLEKETIQINIGLQADYQGVYTSRINIDDVTYPEPVSIFFGLYEGETIAEDERFGKLLENFGRDVTPEQELIMRDSDVNEGRPDFELLNSKRKEMLLEGDNIWPYVGSYRGLVNIVNWFGYYDVRIKEYWLNVAAQDEYFGKYRQLQIPFQLKDKGASTEGIELLPSKHYKKTNLFGLFYDLVRDGGNFDEFGVPITVDAFEYTNEEILIKLFALKRYLKDKFLPLNSRIIDITGEGVYYERYAVNSWNDPVSVLEVNLTRSIDFVTDTKRSRVIDTRPYDPDANLLSPPYYDLLFNYTNKYNINKILVTNPGGPYYGTIPQVSFPGQAVQQARASVKMKGAPIGIVAPLIFSGTGYLPGDIITLAGGSYESPIRITINTVDEGGIVTNFGINEGPNQGSNYTAMPAGFSQSSVVRPTGDGYVIPAASGFTCLATDIPFQVESVFLFDKGLQYSSVPSAVFSPSKGGISVTMDLTTLGLTPAGYFTNNAPVKRYYDSPNIPVGAPFELSTSFNITWDEVVYHWQDLGGGSDATLLSHIDPLPEGTGELIAVEIIGAGSGYNNAPTFTVSGGTGYGGTVAGELKNGKLKILEYTVTAVSSSFGSGDVLTLSPNIPAGGINAIGSARIVKGNGIPDGTITSEVNPGFSEIYLTKINGSSVITSIEPGDKVFIHQGAYVISNGGNYVYPPNVAPNGGHTNTIFTWDELGRGDMYQMEWRVTLTNPVDPNHIYNYFSGIKTIDDLISHKIVLPYAGKYTVELIVYDTDNNYINEIKSDYLDVYLPDAEFTFTTRYIYDCADTWEELFQEKRPHISPAPGMLPPQQPIEPRYVWENAGGRWVNPVFTITKWEDSRISWSSLESSPFSPVNNYTYPEKPPIEVLQISARDNLEGPVISYTATGNPSVTVSGQRPYPPIANGDYIYIRRDDVFYQVGVQSADYLTTGQTTITLSSAPPSAFTSNPTTWEVLREISGNIVLSGNLIYNEETNASGIKIGDYVRIVGTDDTPKKSRVGVKSKNTYSSDPSTITLNGGGTDSSYYKGGELGKIYKYRNDEVSNGNLFWNPTEVDSTWVIRPSSSTDSNVNSHIGRVYIVDLDPAETGTVGCYPANPVNEFVPGFTILHIYGKNSDDEVVYDQRLRTKHVYLDNGTSGEAYDIWSSLDGEDSWGGVYVIDVNAIDGGSLSGLNVYLQSIFDDGGTVWMEYEYEVFPTRSFTGSDSSGDAQITMDFNMFPASGVFSSATAGNFPATATGGGWFYDHGIASGDFSLYVKNAGYWQGSTNNTLVTVDDPTGELLQCSTSFTATQSNFDEDEAEKRLGSLVQVWENSRSLVWDETCFHSWDTLDYPEALGCNFRISKVTSNGGIQFCNDSTYFFGGIVGGMSSPQRISQALYGLQNISNTGATGGLGRFSYQVASATATDLSYMLGGLNTYRYSSTILSATGSTFTPQVGDGVIARYLAPATEISGTASVTGGVDLSLNINIPKKKTFVGDIKEGEFYVRNIKGLLETDVYVGEVISGTGLNFYPLDPSKVIDIIVSGGQITQLRLSESARETYTQSAFNVEWFTPNDNKLSFQLLKDGADFYVDAYANSPGSDSLGWLTAYNGVEIYDWSGNSVLATGHTYPLRNTLQRFGYGNGFIGGFEEGPDEFYKNERNLQAYFFQGENPNGGARGWYPAASLPPNYSYIGGTGFGNTAAAAAQSNRLPYETAIGGAWTWEDTIIGSSPTKLPTGISVLLSSEASQIAGKTKFFWRLKDEEGKTLVELVNPVFMWTFNYVGKYSVELEISDTNGNRKNYSKKDFFEIYETIKQHA